MITIKDKSNQHIIHNCKICREEGKLQAKEECLKEVTEAIEDYFRKHIVCDDDLEDLLQSIHQKIEGTK